MHLLLFFFWQSCHFSQILVKQVIYYYSLKILYPHNLEFVTLHLCFIFSQAAEMQFHYTTWEAKKERKKTHKFHSVFFALRHFFVKHYTYEILQSIIWSKVRKLTGQTIQTVVSLILRMLHAFAFLPD